MTNQIKLMFSLICALFHLQTCNISKLVLLA
jgi:hypothetical protein